MDTIGLIFRILNILLMMGIPCLAVWLLVRREPGGFRPIWIGVVAFVLSQVGHIPFNRYLLMPGLEKLGVDLTAQEGLSLVVLGLAVGLSAGLFEELARYLAFSVSLKEDRGELVPVKYAVGHGGIEALLTGILALLALVQVVALGREGVLAAFPPEQADLIRSQIQTYWAVPGGQALLGAWERVSAMLFHLGASLLVYRAVRSRKLVWLLAALVGHAALNGFAVIFVQKLNYFLLEGLIFAAAVIWVAWCWFIRYREEPEGLSPAPPPADLGRTDPPASPRQLEESRYD